MKKTDEISTTNKNWHTLEEGKPHPAYPIEAELEIDASRVQDTWYPSGSKGHIIGCVRTETNMYSSLADFKDYAGNIRKLRIPAKRILRWRYKPNYLVNVDVGRV